MKTAKKGNTLFLMGMLAMVLTFGLVATGCVDKSEPGNPDTTPTQATYTVTYNGNGSDGGAAPVDSTVYIQLQTVTVLGIGSLTKTNHHFAGWNTKPDGTGTWYYAGNTFMGMTDVTLYAVWVSTATKDFRAQRWTDGTWYTVTAKPLAEGAHCIVYADETTGVTTGTGENIAAEYESKIYGKITSSFGGIEDVDGNGKVIFLLLDIIDGYTGSGGLVAGYFDPTHMFSTSVNSNSNQADMLFLDVNPAVPGSHDFYATIAHELQHLINFSKHPTSQQEIWINEGLSTAAEHIYGGIQQDRIDWFNYDPYGSIRYGNNFFVWDGYWEHSTTIPETGNQQDTLANYATAYLFFQWLRIQASNGTAIYKDIIDSSYTDYRAVTEAAGSRIGSTFSSWDTLLSTWMIANAIGTSSGNYGYKGQIVTRITYFNVATPVTNYEFAPGEGIYSLFAGSHTSLSASDASGSGAHIKYAGIPSSGTTIDRTAPYTGLILLTYNANTVPNAIAYENGVILNYQNSGVTGNRLMSVQSVNNAPAYTPPASYPIGSHDKVAEREFKGTDKFRKPSGLGK